MGTLRRTCSTGPLAWSCAPSTPPVPPALEGESAAADTSKKSQPGSCETEPKAAAASASIQLVPSNEKL
eukprot:CAMPEP_0180521008 /NCGR_PEP_ID=MMETSP1036_2-20121128/56585_1 /TAXON_ID=632150 /ORGANISM="Azadinium spinosum, Strain 3D9" /LENGTH=68 /DNA_ID=CAMNT_0022533571 /DNA_START=25 /DNA_END=227 /DNA_ORIENTATION=-